LKKIFSTLVLILFLLQACSLPKVFADKRATETPIPSPIPSLTASVIPQITPSPTPKSFDPSPVRMVASDDTKIETLSTAVMQTDPPSWLRKRFVYPVGGIEGWPYCEAVSETPYFLNSPTTFYALSSDPWNEDRIATCGWGEGEKVTITVTNPDGTQEINSQSFEDGQGISYRPEMKYGMQLGEYSITFESPSGTLSSSFEIVAPNQPGIIEAAEKKYFVYGFQPGEHVYILAYIISQDDRTIRMTTWVETTLDERGELLLYNKSSADLLAVVGDSNGLYWSNVFWGIFIGDKVFFKNFDVCAGTPTSRLQPYDLAYVLEGSPNNVRSSPSISADLVGTVMPGTVLYVGKQDPVCADGYLWWYVYPKVGMDPTGWTAEGKGSVYWLAPAK
jgi:hypothetical protein